MAKPNRTFFSLVVIGATLIATIGWSAHHLLLAGAPAFAVTGSWPGFSCLLLPYEGDFVTHLASYLFLGAILAGTACGARTLVRLHRQTQALLQTCLSARSTRWRSLRPLVRRLGLQGRLDLVELPAPLAFCYGYFRPRVLISTALVVSLPGRELEALLLHEREHLRQRDPLKVAVGKLLASAVFFVPALGALYSRFLTEKELAADLAAIAQLGESDSLGSALIRLLERGRVGAPVLTAGMDQELEARIDALVGDPVQLGPSLPIAGLGGSLVVAVIAVTPLLGPLLPTEIAVSSHNLLTGCHLTS